MSRVPAELEVEQLRSVLKLRRVAHPVSVLIGVTAISGAFVAGMKVIEACSWMMIYLGCIM